MVAGDKINVLIVDDQAKNLLALEAVLENPQYELVKARSGEEALKALLREDFAVILLDVMMPGMNGFETAELIRDRDRSRYTPIIFVTAVGMNEAHVSRGYSVGAVDYLFKPIVPEILRSKVAAFAELFRKTEEIRRQEQRLRELQQREHEAKLAEAERRLEAERLQCELHLAHEIQQHLFPKNLAAHQHLDIAGKSVPANAAGGDYFDYLVHPDGYLDVAIGDVSGHGVGAALLMAATRAYLRAFAPQGWTPGQVLAEVNRALAEDILGGQFVTLTLVRIASDSRSLIYASAGHNSGFLLDAAGDVKTELESTGPPLGIMEDAEFETSAEIPFESDDILFLYTDGVVEACAPDESYFGIERAIEVVRSHKRQQADDIVEALQSAVMGFTRSQSRDDDVTTVVLRAGAKEQLTQPAGHVAS